MSFKNASSPLVCHFIFLHQMQLSAILINFFNTDNPYMGSMLIEVSVCVIVVVCLH